MPKEPPDHVGRFLSEATVVEEGAEVKASTLYHRYDAWCEVNGERAMSGTAFGLRMVGDGHEKKKTGHVCYIGIGLLSEA